METEQRLSELRRDIAAIIKKRYAEGKPGLIRPDIEALVSAPKYAGAAARDAESIRKSVEREERDAFVAARTGPPSSASIGTAFARVQGAVNEDVVREVGRGLRSGASLRELSASVERVLRRGQHQAATVGRTARLGANRAAFVERAQKAGAAGLRYAGPSAGRPFCARHLGNAYTFEEVAALDNGQGLDVLRYCGGWNCRHRWEAWYGKVESFDGGGALATEDTWRAAREVAPKAEAAKMDRSRDVALAVARLGLRAELNAVKRNRRGGDVDLIVQGVPAEAKEPDTDFTARGVERLLRSKNSASERQSDYFIVRLVRPMLDVERRRLVGKLRLWMFTNPGVRVAILHDYGTPFLEEITNE